MPHNRKVLVTNRVWGFDQLEDFFETNSTVQPFYFKVPKNDLDHILRCVADYPWHEMPDDGGWDYGTNLEYLKELRAYSVDKFDWRAKESKINSFSNYTALDDGIHMHFIFEKGSGKNSMPLMISHGWPKSVSEFFELIGPLAHPEQFGGDIEDAFTLILPSLQGFAFSGIPPRP